MTHPYLDNNIFLTFQNKNGLNQFNAGISIVLIVKTLKNNVWISSPEFNLTIKKLISGFNFFQGQLFDSVHELMEFFINRQLFTND